MAGTIYLSSSGDDSNLGSTELEPISTIEHAKSLLRSGIANRLLIRRGDRFGKFGDVDGIRGREESPIFIGTYGDVNAPRPIFDSGTSTNLSLGAKPSRQPTFEHVTVEGIEFIAGGRVRNPESAPPANGIELFGNVEDVVFKNCQIEGYRFNFTFQKLLKKMDNITIDGCQILDSFSVRKGDHSSGIYAEKVDGLVIEDSVFYHNGWREGVKGAEPTRFNHGAYIQKGTRDLIFRNNLVVGNASHGVQARTGGLVQGNLLIDNAIGMSVSTDESIGQIKQNVIDNVVIHASSRTLGHDREDGTRAWGYDIFKDRGQTVVSNNMALHSPDGEDNAARVHSRYRNGISIYAWGKEEDTLGDAFETRTAMDYVEARVGTTVSLQESVKVLTGMASTDRNTISDIVEWIHGGGEVAPTPLPTPDPDPVPTGPHIIDAPTTFATPATFGVEVADNVDHVTTWLSPPGIVGTYPAINGVVTIDVPATDGKIVLTPRDAKGDKLLGDARIDLTVAPPDPTPSPDPDPDPEPIPPDPTAQIIVVIKGLRRIADELEALQK